VNLVVEMEARNIAQRNAIFFCVKLGENATTHGKLQQAFRRSCNVKSTSLSLARFLKAESLIKMSSAARNHEQHGQVTTQNG
jgi:hypothetical protein